jgi:hypothetical protein
MDTETLGAIAVPAIAIPATYVLLRYKARLSRRVLEKHFQETNTQATVEKVGIPPLRLWLSNRKGDSWCLIRTADGSRKWARLGFRRRRLGGNVPIEFFD